MIDLKAIAAEVKPLILQAGDIITDAWNTHNFNSTLKDERDIVTDIDTQVENYLRKYLYNILPQAGFVVEEGKTEMMGEYNWTIDPIDGTKYFASQVPLFFTQVALLKNNEPVISFIYNPVTKQLFSAIQGNGSYINDAKLTKKPNTPLSHCIVNFDLDATHGQENEWKYEIFQKVAQKCYRARVTAGYLAPYLPLGAVDISINTAIKNPYTTKNITDLAPHKLLLIEAGYSEELIQVNHHPVLIWASKEHILELKALLQ
jgi:myo-inositol-1(or 4)-monophosphatase